MSILMTKEQIWRRSKYHDESEGSYDGNETDKEEQNNDENSDFEQIWNRE